MVSSGDESIEAEGTPPLQVPLTPKRPVPARWWFLVQFIPETMETSCCPSPAGD